MSARAIAVVLGHVGLAAAQQCVFNFPGATWDLSPLRARSPFTSVYGTNQYVFGFCDNIAGSSCPRLNNASISFLQNSAKICIESFGSAAYASARQITASGLSGLVLTYSDPASSCGLGLASTAHTILCDPQAPPPVVITPAQQAGCSLQYTIRTPLVCPTGPGAAAGSAGKAQLSAGWVIFIVLVAGAGAYVGGGMLWNRWKHGAQGLEAIPHIALWRRACAWLSCAPRGAFDYARAGAADSSTAYMLAEEEGALPAPGKGGAF